MKALVLLLFVSACASRAEDMVPPELQIDSTFAPEERVVVLQAVSRWEAATGRSNVGNGWRIVKQIPPNGGAGWAEGRVVQISPGLSSFELSVTATHELGHVLGLGHTTSGVMRGGEGLRGPDTDVITEADLEECRRAGACPQGS